MNLAQCAAAQLLATEGLPVDTLLRLRVVGQSMLPLLQPGDHLSVAPCDFAQLRRGEVVVVRRDDGFVTHRLILLDQYVYRAKGDNQPYLDQPITSTDIVGIVRSVERDGLIYDFGSGPLKKLNSFLGWVGFVEAHLKIGWVMRPVLSILKRTAVSMAISRRT